MRREYPISCEMRIFFQSYAFYPSCGGIESSARLLIREFKKKGHELRVQTLTPLGDADELMIEGVPISRRTRLQDMLADVDWADVVYQHNPSLRLAMALFQRPSVPVVVSIRTWLRRSDGRSGWAQRLKALWIAHQTVISNSRATASHLSCRSTVIENAYDDAVFRITNVDAREGMAVVGRLVADKGIQTALDALLVLQDQGQRLPMTIIGEGPERTALEAFVQDAGLAEYVRFVGQQSPDEVAAILNQCKYLLVPSHWAEPFGIVALEGIACGCIPIGSNQGGLVDAIGPCGPLFDAGDAYGLAQEILRLETQPERYQTFKAQHMAHLAAHAPRIVAARYLNVFEQALCPAAQI